MQIGNRKSPIVLFLDLSCVVQHKFSLISTTMYEGVDREIPDYVDRQLVALAFLLAVACCKSQLCHERMYVCSFYALVMQLLHGYNNGWQCLLSFTLMKYFVHL